MNIAMWTGRYQYWSSVHPDNLTKAGATQMGGSEAAVLSIAKALAAKGHNVLLGCKTNFAETFGNLRICPFEMFVPTMLTFPFDVLVSWDDQHIFRFALPHIPKKVLVFQLNDTQLGVFEHVIDAYFHPSQWHAERFAKEYAVPEDKQFHTLINAIDPYLFLDAPTRQPHIIWASSPDRGLHHLLRMWPSIIEQVPDAHLHIYYDMDKWLATVADIAAKGYQVITSERAAQVRQGMAVAQMTYHGGVGKLEVAAVLARAKVMAYPCEPVAPTEGFSMTTLESYISGCEVIISDADALPELWGWREGVTCLPLPVADDIWIDTIVKGLRADTPAGPRLVPQDLTWDYRAEQWEEAIQCLTP